MQKKDIQLETILDSIADGVFTVDLEKNITSFNRAAELITGIPRKQALGQKCFDVFHANICQGFCALEKTIASGRPIVDLHIKILNSSGNTVPVSVSTAVLRNERGKIVGGVETFRDLSAIEQMRKELSRQYSFMDIISKNHEIQKILTSCPTLPKATAPCSCRARAAAAKSCLLVPFMRQVPEVRDPTSPLTAALFPTRSSSRRCSAM